MKLLKQHAVYLFGITVVMAVIMWIKSWTLQLNCNGWEIVKTVGTCIAPLAAVGIFIANNWWQQYKSDKQARTNLFFDLANNRIRTSTHEFRNAINNVPKYFLNDKEVMDVYKLMMQTFHNTNLSTPLFNHTHSHDFNDKMVVPPNASQASEFQALILRLLVTINNSTGLNMSESEINAIGYAPGWLLDDSVPQKVCITDVNGNVPT